MAAGAPRNTGLHLDKYLTCEPVIANIPQYSVAVTREVHPHPTPYTLGQFARLAYKSNPGKVLLKLQKKGLVRDWVVLCRARNRSCYIGGNGYCGVAFWHPAARQLVFAHRGTKPLKAPGSLWADCAGVCCNNVVGQLLSAMTFVQQVLSMMRGSAEAIFMTGHSLGGWIAAGTTYTAQYLTATDGQFQYAEGSEAKPRWKPHTVTFESPGSLSIVRELQARCEPSQDPKSSPEQIDITAYVSTPNIINTANPHLGRLIAVDNKPAGCLAALMNCCRKLKTEHSMKSMLEEFDESTGFLKKESQEIRHWPSCHEERRAVRQGISTLSQPQGARSLPLQWEPTQLNQQRTACLTPDASLFLHVYSRLPQHIKNIHFPLPNGCHEVLNSCTLEKHRVTCRSPSDLLLLVPTVSKLMELHPLYLGELFTLNNQNMYSAAFENVKFVTTLISEDFNATVHCKTTEDTCMTTQRIKSKLKNVVVLSEADLALLSEEAILRGFAADQVVILNIRRPVEEHFCADKLRELGCAGVRKMVVVTPPMETSFGEKLIVEETHWGDIDEEDRAALLRKKCVSFQGSDQLVSLSDLSESFETMEPNQLDEEVGCEILKELLRRDGAVIQVGEALPVTEFYVPRALGPRKIDKSIFKLCARKYFFVVRGMSEEKFESELTSDDGDISQELCYHIVANGGHENLNELKLGDKQMLVMKHCHGNFYFWDVGGKVESLREYCNTDEERCYFEETDFVGAAAPQVSIVDGEPGLGKSLVLESLAWGLKQGNPNGWVLFINLNRHTDALNARQNQKFADQGSLIRFIADDVMGVGGVDGFLLRESCEQGRCCIVVDSFDEISPRYKDGVLDFLSSLKRWNVYRRLVVASREHLVIDLENAMQQFTATLAKFSTDDIDDFLHMKLEKNPVGVDVVKERLLRIQQHGKLLRAASNPLILGMLAEILSQEDLGDKSITMAGLYSKFIENKKAIWRKTKGSTTCDTVGVFQSQIDQVEEYHKALACEMLFPDDPEMIRSSAVPCDELHLSLGIIKKSDKSPHFVHQTFKEFYMAKVLLDVLGQETITMARSNVILNEVLVSDDHAMVRGFLNDLLETHDNVPTVDKEDGMFQKKKNGRAQWILHVAAKENHVEILRYFEKYCCVNEMVDWNDELNAVDKNGNTPMHCAAKHHAFDVLNFLPLESQVLNKVNYIKKGCDIYRASGKMTPVHELLNRTMKHKTVVDQCCDWLKAIGQIYDWGTTNLWERTAGHIAAMNGQFRILVKLTEIDEFVKCLTQPDLGGVTPVGFAVEVQPLEGDEDTARLQWLETVSGVWDWAQHPSNGTVLHSAARYENVTGLLALLTSPGALTCLAARDNDNNTFVHCMLSHTSDTDEERDSMLACIRRLNDLKYDWQLKGQYDKTVLHFAAEAGKFTALEELSTIPGMAECLSMTDGHGNTPVYLAVQAPLWSDVEIAAMVNFLRWAEKNGYDWSLKGVCEETPMHMAARKGNFVVLDELMKIDDVREQVLKKDEDSYTPVHAALSMRPKNGKELERLVQWLQSVERLTSFDWTLKGRMGKTVFHLAAEEGNFTALMLLATIPGMTSCLTERDRYGNTPVHLALGETARSSELEAMLEWLDWVESSEYPWPCPGSEMRTALHEAAATENFTALNHLTKFQRANACLSERDAKGYTPVHVAMSSFVEDAVLLEWLRLVTSAHYDWKSTGMDGKTALHVAAKERRFGFLLDLMSIRETHQCLSMPDESNNTPVHIALARIPSSGQHARCDLLREVCSTGYDWTVKGEKGKTVLHFAASRGNFAILLQLTEYKGVDSCLSETDADGNTAVHVSAGCKVKHHKSMILWFDWIGSTTYDWSLTGQKGKTVLHFAAEKGNFTVLMKLRNIPAVVKCLSIRDDDGNTPVHVVLSIFTNSREKQEVMGEWLQWVRDETNYDWTLKGEREGTVLHLAAYASNYRALRLLRTIQAMEDNLSVRDCDGNTPVHLAVSADRKNDALEEWLDWVVSCGFDWASEGKKNRTVLHSAVKGRNYAVLRKLTEIQGMNQCLSRVDSDGDTPVHIAMGGALNSDEQYENVLAWLRWVDTQGHDWTLKGMLGRTAVHCAAKKKNTKLLSALKDLPGIQQCLTKYDESRDTPVLTAFQHCYDDSVELDDVVTWLRSVEDSGYDWNLRGGLERTALHMGAAVGSAFLLMLKLTDIRGLKDCVAVADDSGNTPVHLAMSVDEEFSLKFRLRWLEWVDSLPFDWSLRGEKGRTAMHVAAKDKNFRLLLATMTDRAACCLDILDDKGNSPVHYVMMAGASNHREFAVRWLLWVLPRYNWRLPDRSGRNALHLAAHNGYFDFLRKLKDIPDVVECLAMADSEGKTPLDIAMSRDWSSPLKDAQRLWFSEMRDRGVVILEPPPPTTLIPSFTAIG